MSVKIDLNGKVAIITGASRGIGEAIARAFARAGAMTVLASRKRESLEKVAQKIREEGGVALALPCHVGRQEEVESLVRSAVERFGKVDVLVNNAATNPYFGPMMLLEESAWDKTFEVNLKGPFYAIRALVRHLQERQAPGSIINIASVAGMMGMPLQGIYAMTKAALISMTRTLAIELGPAQIRVNAIAPGLIDTRFSAALVSNEEIRGSILNRLAIKRIGVPDDVASLALLLASDASSYITGACFVVDGGWSIT
ncbi:MAG: glucose 1-dehydrogenase [Sandaracinaceae bacterium]|nr:glucose 1-dehydrogenase [Sandaracinaceae bacterium]